MSQNTVNVPAADPVAAPAADPAVNITLNGDTAVVTPAGVPAAEPAAAPEGLPEGFNSVADLAKSYNELRAKMSGAQPEAPAGTPADAAQPTAADVAAAAALTASLTAVAGTQQDLTSALDWARANLGESERTAFDAACDSGNEALARMAMQSVMSAFRAAVPVEPTRVQGEPAPAGPLVQPYASRAQVVADMNKLEYKQDPAFRNAVANRLAVSSIL
jgi:hypothetical protein